MKIYTFKDYWETKQLITFREYILKYKRATILEQEILQNIYNDWDWCSISANTINITLNFIREFCRLVNWDIISKRDDLTEEFIIEFEQRINFYNIQYNNLSIYFIRRYKHLLNWDKLSNKPYLNEEYYEEFQSYINWNIISNKQLSESFIKKYKNKLNLEYLLANNFNQSLLLEFHDKINYKNLPNKSFEYFVNCKKYAIKIQKWYKYRINKKKKNIILDKILNKSKKNLLIKNILINNIYLKKRNKYIIFSIYILFLVFILIIFYPK